MKILQLEASNGWGGQEIRTLKEATWLQSKGHTTYFVTSDQATLGKRAKESGFTTFTIPFERRQFLFTLYHLIRLILTHKIDVVCTHSSWDGWIGGIAARLTGRKVLRTRHLSTPIKKGLNSYFLYNVLADQVITTCERVSTIIKKQAKMNSDRCRSIPTGAQIENLVTEKKEWDLPQDAFLVGTACILRSWKGLMPLLQSIKDLENVHLVFIGDGPMRPHLEQEAKNLGISERVIFTGFLENPFPYIASLDLFALLSTAHEGVSQATLQAAWLERPLLTTAIGGLDEVCIPGKTGMIVPPNDPRKTSEAIQELQGKDLKTYGENAKKLVSEKFLFEKTMGSVASVYDSLHQA